MNNKSHSSPNSSGKDSVSDTPLGIKSDLESPKKHKEESLAQLEMIKRMMERSTRFLHLSGLAGMLAGIFALISSYIVIVQFGFQPDTADYPYFLNDPAVNEWGYHPACACYRTLSHERGGLSINPKSEKTWGKTLDGYHTESIALFFDSIVHRWVANSPIMGAGIYWFSGPIKPYFLWIGPDPC